MTIGWRTARTHLRVSLLANTRNSRVVWLPPRFPLAFPHRSVKCPRAYGSSRFIGFASHVSSSYHALCHPIRPCPQCLWPAVGRILIQLSRPGYRLPYVLHRHSGIIGRLMIGSHLLTQSYLQIGICIPRLTPVLHPSLPFLWCQQGGVHKMQQQPHFYAGVAQSHVHISIVCTFLSHLRHHRFRPVISCPLAARAHRQTPANTVL